jgi:GH25 family lysozyme M1 (1,4-beta-N-acetylmuramidase)
MTNEEKEARKEADCFIERLRGKKFAYPVYYDVEGDMLDLDGKALTAIVKAFLERVEAVGYWVGLYMSGCPMHDKIDSSVLKRYALWVADTRGVQPSTYLGAPYGMWQYNGNGSVSGITGDVDLDYCYTDYPTQIKAKGLNGYGKADPVPAPAPDDGIPVRLEIGDQTYVGKLDKLDKV